VGRGGDRKGRGEVGMGLKSQTYPHPAPPRGAGLKSYPIPAPPPLRGEVGRGGEKLSSLNQTTE